MRSATPTEKQNMLCGQLYRASDPELTADRQRADTLLHQYNALELTAEVPRDAILQQLFGSIGPGVTIRAPFFCDYGYNLHLGPNVFLNFNCVLLDVMPIHIGAGTEIGPAVQIYAADHPRDPAIRRSGLECGKPVTVGQHVWIGGGAIPSSRHHRRRRRNHRRRQRRQSRRSAWRHGRRQPRPPAPSLVHPYYNHSAILPTPETQYLTKGGFPDHEKSIPASLCPCLSLDRCSSARPGRLRELSRKPHRHPRPHRLGRRLPCLPSPSPILGTPAIFIDMRRDARYFP